MIHHNVWETMASLPGKLLFLPLSLRVSEATPLFRENCSLLFRVSSGNVLCKVNGLKVSLREGQYGFLLPYHCFSFLPLQDNAEIQYVKTDTLLLLYSRALSQADRPAVCAGFSSPFSDPDATAASLLNDLWESLSASPGFQNASSVVGQMIALLEGCRDPFADLSSQADTYQFIEWVFCSLPRHLLPEETALIHACSVSDLDNLCMQAVGADFSDTMDLLRAIYMSLWILDRSLSLEGKLQTLGFSSTTRFYRCFKQIFHNSYRQYVNDLFKNQYQNPCFDLDQRGSAILLWLQNHCCESWDKEEYRRQLKECFQMDQKYVDKLLLYKYGCTFAKLRNSLRIRKAAGLLLGTRLSLEQIAEMCGYSSLQTCKRQFLKQYHRTPKEYRLRFSEAEHEHSDDEQLV